jgi:ElaB/YqjD/DUF883 family membrane-anchored ribosome-binding protein
MNKYTTQSEATRILAAQQTHSDMHPGHGVISLPTREQETVMTETNEHHAEVKDEPRDRSPSDLDTLKSSFAQLRDDVIKLLHDTLGTGESGAVILKDRASSAVADVKDRMGDLKDRGVESVEHFGQMIGERPLLSAAIALGIGFVLAKLLTTKR